VGKYVLSILGVLSLIWIGYVGLNLASGEPITPETTFGKADKTVVIVHKPLEPDYEEPAFNFLATTDFYTAILTHTERIQHFYFSSTRPVVLLERSKPWTIELIDRYFSSMGIAARFESAKSFTLSNGWKASYNGEYLLVSKGNVLPVAHSAINWKYVDRKSSASVLRWENGLPLIENAYRGSASAITYISQAAASKPALADDQDIFQDIVPAKFGAYTFYEKNYLRSISPAASALPFDWMDAGAIVLRYDGRSCVVTDCIPGQDPIAILGNQLDESSVSENKNSAFVRNVRLPGKLLQASDWYIEVFNNRVFIARDKNTIDNIIGAYETGATLSQNEALRSSLFVRVPKRVSYRSILPNEHRTMSLLNRSRHTVVQRYGAASDEPEEVEEETEETTKAIRIEGGIAELIPVQGTNFLYVVSKTNVIYGIQGDEERWKILIPSTIVGKPVLSESKNELIVTTGTAIHQLSKSGNEVNGQPIVLSTAPLTAAVPYSWKGSRQLAVLYATQLQVLNPNGTVKNSVAVPFTPRASNFVIWSNAGELTATIAGKNKGINLPVERRRKGKEFQLPDTELQAVKTAAGPLFYGVRAKRLISVSHKGLISDLNRGNVTALLPAEENNGNTFLKVLSGKSVYVLQSDGRLLTAITPGFGDIAGCAYQTAASGKSVIGILDGIANKNYIYDLNGKQLTAGSFDGNSIVALHRLQNGKLVLISQSNNYLVRYPI
jgi:hypothetical protein